MTRRSAQSGAPDLAALSAWAPELADTFVALACDIALVLDDQGVIRKLTQHAAQPLLPGADWVGLHWVETACTDSRGKVLQMLADVAARGVARRREINHPHPASAALAAPETQVAQEASVAVGVAVAYTAIRLGEAGPTLAVGHDLRTQADLQQRFVAAQQALEQSYWQAQQNEPTHAAVAANRTLAADERAQPLKSAASARTNGPPAAVDAQSQALLSALDGLHERIGRDALPGLLRDAKRLIEQHFLVRALEASGSDAAVARSLGISQRTLTRRKGGGARKAGSA